MGLHAAIIRLSPLIHKGEQRYKPYIVGDPRMVSPAVTPPLKNPGYAPERSPKKGKAPGFLRTPELSSSFQQTFLGKESVTKP